MASYDSQNKITTPHVAYKPLLMSGILSTAPHYETLILTNPHHSAPTTLTWFLLLKHTEFFLTLELLFLLSHTLITLFFFFCMSSTSHPSCPSSERASLTTLLMLASTTNPFTFHHTILLFPFVRKPKQLCLLGHCLLQNVIFMSPMTYFALTYYISSNLVECLAHC